MMNVPPLNFSRWRDIPYVWTDEGRAYLAVDLYSRAVVGWALGDSLSSTQLPLAALSRTTRSLAIERIGGVLPMLGGSATGETRAETAPPCRRVDRRT